MWIKRLKATGHIWKDLCLELFPFLDKIELYGPSYAFKHCYGNPFWKDVFLALKTIGTHVNPTNQKEFLSENVFYNSKITVGGHEVAFKRWTQKGVCRIADFVKDDGNFLTVVEFNNKYRMQVDFLCYAGIISAIRKYMRKTNVTLDSNLHNNLPCYLNCLSSNVPGSKPYYEILAKDETDPKCCRKWEAKLNVNINWKTVFQKIHKIKEIKLKWLQIRIVHRIIGINIVLKEMGVVENNLCSFCLKQRDTINHCFWDCDVIQRFWSELSNFLNEKCTHAFNLQLSQNLVLLGTERNIRTDCTLDYIILSAKAFIYHCKNNRCLPTLENFKIVLQKRYNIERHNALMSNALQQFNAQWSNYQEVVHTDM